MRRVLVVEDYPPLAKVLAIGLRRLGYDVARVGSGRRARLLEGAFAVALVDVDLPDDSGVALARFLMDSGRTDGVVFFSASRDPDVIAEARRVGAWVSKQDGVEAAIAAVDAACESLDARAKVVGLPDGPETRESGRSGTRRRVR
jgi:CheY-like chemotaxis protein